MMLFSRIGANRPRHSFCSPSRSSNNYMRRLINPRSNHQPHHRWNSGPSSSGSNNNNVVTTITKRRSKRKKQSFSPLLQIASNHPRNTDPHPSHITTTSSSSGIKLLTRRQLLRLTPKQRSNLQRHRSQQHKDSMSYLQQARINVRSNLNFLSDTAGSNFQKNVQTIQRLFRGEEKVWPEEIVGGSKQLQQQQSSQKQSKLQQEEEVGIDWERVPSEIKQNVQTNLASVQNWLHKATDGMIPSPSLINKNSNTSSSNVEGSIATRMQRFHQAKQSSGLVMDGKWIAWNIALALLPGAMVGMYLHSLQDEMKEYYVKLEAQERARILGPSSETSIGNRGGEAGSDKSPKSKNDDMKGMGISSAFIEESGGVLDKVKMAVNDLLLGGVEERVGKARDNEKQHSGNVDHQEQLDRHDESVTASKALSETEENMDPTVKILLQRIEKLEKQLRLDKQESSHVAVEKDECNGNNVLDRTSRQSPMQNRRSAALASKWSKEEQSKKAESISANNDESESTDNESKSTTLWKFVLGLQSLLENDINYAREVMQQKVGMLQDLFAVDGKKEDVDEAKVCVVDAQEATIDNASQKVDLTIENASPSTTAVEPAADERGVTQAKDKQEKGFRAWIAFYQKKRSQPEASGEN